MNGRRYGGKGLLLLLIYGSFALLSMLLTVTGAHVYSDIVSTGRENTQLRSSLSYAANKVRMSTRAAGTVRIEVEGGITVLVLEAAAKGYQTRIYYYEGALRELYQAAEQPFWPDLGEKLMEVSEFQMEETDAGHLVLRTEDSEGKTRSLHLYIEGKAE